MLVRTSCFSAAQLKRGMPPKKVAFILVPQPYPQANSGSHLSLCGSSRLGCMTPAIESSSPGCSRKTESFRYTAPLSGIATFSAPLSIYGNSNRLSPLRCLWKLVELRCLDQRDAGDEWIVRPRVVDFAISICVSIELIISRSKAVDGSPSSHCALAEMYGCRQ